MQAFIRTLAYGLAAICLLLVSGGVTVLVMAKSRGAFDPTRLRTILLSDEEQAWLSDYHQRGEEPPALTQRAPDEEALLRRIAELGAADEAQRLVSTLRRQKQSMDERQAWLDRQEAELQLARADLERLRGQLDDRLASVQRETELKRKEYAAWAADAAAETRRMDVLRGIELERAKDLAKRFELQKDDAWAGLRVKTPSEVARYLALMDPKRASRLLTLAGQDKEYPEMVQSIHRAWLALDLEGLSGDQVSHLASLYSYMAPADVAAGMRSSNAKEAAAILTAIDDPKKEAAILLAIRAEDPAREAEIQTHLGEAKGAVQ
jgi:hypothetical protein